MAYEATTTMSAFSSLHTGGIQSCISSARASFAFLVSLIILFFDHIVSLSPETYRGPEVDNSYVHYGYERDAGDDATVSCEDVSACCRSRFYSNNSRFH